MELKTIKAKKAYFDTNLFIYLIEKHPAYVEEITALGDDAFIKIPISLAFLPVLFAATLVT